METTTDTTDLLWRKSTHSTGDGDCLESASTKDGVLVRDTKGSKHRHLTIDATSWAQLLSALKS
ncbi:DUF397 domain-containing protein [Streptomyces sp. SID3343]|uniref:DUF397 domain-containing protein n=1 Tax=Streptomyces sp. SID3343 TaxID=2690260 RepID=UPI001367DCA5|nr:DUF397 domain-containing protein [Streptomyces sp. SID3343]MYW03191.1 DUF397 domain-containing protein [Streptomyces sp. SID3343]